VYFKKIARYNHFDEKMVGSVQPSIKAFISLPDMAGRPSEKGYEPSEGVVSLCDTATDDALCIFE